MIYFAYESNPIKYQGGKELVTSLAHIMDGWRKEDPPNNKKLPVGTDIMVFLEYLGRDKDMTELLKVVGDLTLIALYYLLRVV